jgi:hypothetical protein
MDWIRKANAELEAEAAAAKAAQLNDEAEACEQDAEASEASGDEAAQQAGGRTQPWCPQTGR